MDDQQFLKLLHYFGLSWKGYRKVRKGVKKRIRRHMQKLGCHSTKAYFHLLDRDQVLRLECERLMTVSISRFFRDRGLWQTLENQILPKLIQKNRKKAKVWSAGCACGEEVYSFKILWERLQGQVKTLPVLDILATDMNPVYLNKAKSGMYPRSSLREVPEDMRSLYFKLQKKKEMYTIIPFLKEGIIWKKHHLLSDPPGKDFHFIFMRNNLLTYYKDEVKKPAFKKIADSLLPGGFLLIGTHEEIPLIARELFPLKKLPYIFQKRPSSSV